MRMILRLASITWLGVAAFSAAAASLARALNPPPAPAPPGAGTQEEPRFKNLQVLPTPQEFGELLARKRRETLERMGLPVEPRAPRSG